jgi:phage RecT family recombinase
MNENSNLPAWKKALTDSYPKFQALNPERAKAELGFAMSIFQSNPSLQKCDPTSILNSVVSVARTSITLNPVMRLAYLIPRKGKCILEFSYMGLVALLRDNGCIRTISAHIVYSDEHFEHNIAANQIIHIPSYAETEAEHNQRKIIGCYSRATLPTGDISYEFMPMWEIDKVKNMSKGGMAWKEWRDEMIKKSVIKRHFKLLISTNTSEALHTALQIENENNQLISNYSNSNQRNLMTGFDDLKEQKVEQPTLFVESPSETSQQGDKHYRQPYEMSEDELNLALEEEAKKINKQDPYVTPPKKEETPEQVVSDLKGKNKVQFGGDIDPNLIDDLYNEKEDDLFTKKKE